MADFLSKLKKGMNINTIKDEEEPEEIKEDFKEEPEEESVVPPVPLGPEEIEMQDLEKRMEEKAPDDEGMKAAAVKNFVLSNIKEVDKTKKAKKPSKKAVVKEDKEENWLEPEGQLVIDVYETDNEIVIQSAIAGITPENLDISIEKDMVSIKGKRESATERTGKNYLIEECYWGAFSREIILPSEVDAAKAQASMKNGILTIRAPKIERERKKVTVR